MYDCIYFTDIGKKLVAKTFSLAGTLYESCNINEFDRCRSYLFCMIKLTELYDSFIRNRYDTDIRIDRCKRVICR